MDCIIIIVEDKRWCGWVGGCALGLGEVGEVGAERYVSSLQ